MKAIKLKPTPKSLPSREARIRARMAAMDPCYGCQLLGFPCSLHRARAV